MAITAIGYSGSIDEGQHVKLMAEAGNSSYSVIGPTDFRVRPDISADRGVYVDTGAAMSYGLYVQSSAIERLAAGSVAAGSRRFDCVVLENDFNPTDGTPGKSRLRIMPGTPSAIIPTLIVNPGVLTQQPLCLIEVAPGSTQIQSFIDLRQWTQKFSVASSQFGLPPARLGGRGRVGNDYYDVVLDGAGNPAWQVQRPTGSILTALGGSFAPLAPSAAANERVWSGNAGAGYSELLASIYVPDYGRPVRAEVRFTMEGGSTQQSTRWDVYAQFDSYQGEVIGMQEGGRWFDGSDMRFFDFHPLTSNAFQGARNIQFLARPGFTPNGTPALGRRTNFNTYVGAVIHAA